MRLLHLLSHILLSAFLVLTVSAKAFSQTRAKEQRVQYEVLQATCEDARA